MAEYYNYNNTLKIFSPNPNYSGAGRPMGWVWENGRVQTSSGGTIMHPKSKLRQLVNVDGATGFSFRSYPQSGLVKLTLGGTVLGTFGPQDTSRTFSIPEGLSGDVLLEIENTSGSTGLSGNSSNLATITNATVTRTGAGVDA